MIIRGRRLFQIIKVLLTGSRALNILFFFPLNPKIIIMSNKLSMGFLSVPNLVPVPNLVESRA